MLGRTSLRRLGAMVAHNRRWLALGIGGASVTAWSQGSACEAAAPEAAANGGGGYTPPVLQKGVSGSFDDMRASVRSRIGTDCERDVDQELRAFVGERTDQHFLWQTLRGDRTIRRVSFWKWADESVPAGAGKARVSALVEVGDALDGHVGIVHGGFTAGLLDDVLGQTTIQEAHVQGIHGAPLTASLTVCPLRVVSRAPLEALCAVAASGPSIPTYERSRVEAVPVVPTVCSRPPPCR